MKKSTVLLVIMFWMVGLVNAQQAPFYKDIQHFKALDQKSPPPKNAILFIGSSSFTNWKDVNDYFPGYTIINRGFGGSILKNQIDYFNDLVPVYKPRQIVIYCGENDLANDQTPADTAVARFKRLYQMIRSYDKKVQVSFVSIKPSPSREKYQAKFEEANTAIKKFLKKKKRSNFIDVFPAMLNEEGKPFPHIFLKDNLHMNASGYQIWQKIMQPYLKK